MNKETPIINIITYRLPQKLANQIYKEFQDRFRDAKYLIGKVEPFAILQQDLKTVELLLAFSVFHKRVITNLEAAVTFYETVSRHSDATTIKIGGYDLTYPEKNKLLGVVLSYKKLIKDFSIPPYVMEYEETKEFLWNLCRLKESEMRKDAEGEEIK